MDINFIKDTTNIIFYLAAAVTALVGISTYLGNLKWNKAKFTKEIIDSLVKNEKTILATYMLGSYESRKYKYTIKDENGTDKEISTNISQSDVIST